MADKVYLITGTSSGIGVGIAECLIKSGAKNLVLVARRKEKLEEVAKACKELGATEVLVLPRDLSDLSTCPDIINETIKKFGRLDVLVNNAAYGNMDYSVATTPDELPQRMFTVNVFAPLALTREAMPHIRKVKGNIIFISSIAAHNAVPNGSTYCATKAALRSIAKTCALEEAPNGVRVNVISPGAILSEMSAPFLGGRTGKEAHEFLAKLQPLPHAGLPEHIGQAVVFLSDDSTGHFATGTDFVIDGGASMNPFFGLSALGLM